MLLSPRLRLRTLAVTLLVCGVTAPAHASIITAWDTLGVNGNASSVTASSNAAHVAGDDLLRGSGLTPSSASNSFSASGWNGQATDYLQFGFQVEAGYQVNLDRLKIATRSSGTGPGKLGLYSSLDGFATPLFTFNQPGTNFLDSEIDLSGLGALTGSVQFRISQIGNVSANGGITGSSGTFRVSDFFSNGVYEDIQLEGSVQVIPGGGGVDPVQTPEPATVLLWGVGSAGLLVLGRRRASGSSR